MMKGLGMDKVKKISLGGWIFYLGGEESNLDRHKCGKWMHFFNNKELLYIYVKKQLSMVSV